MERQMGGGRKIIEGLQDAVRGNFTRVTLQGQVWVRHDVGSPEHELSTARAKVAELTERVDVLEAALRELVDAFNPDRIEEPGLIWGRAALALKGSN